MTWVAVGTGACSASSTSKKKSDLVKSGYFGPEKCVIATPVESPMDLR